MVQRGGNGEFQQMLENYPPSVLKSLVEDQLEEENGPLNKKTKIQLNKDLEMVPPQSIQDSLLEKPSPLGLCLRKTPSLLNLIQSTLSQKNSVSSSYATCNFGFEGGKKKGSRSTALCGTNGKLKASNIPASILRIGSWEYESRYEGDLVGKFYYAQHKIVWEVLVGSAKSKIEVQWSNIAALKAIFDDYAPGTLEIVLAQQPLFFRESNPQPKKHTLWQATSDFTEGQASIHRRHFIQCPSGLLNRHFEKLIQCDPRLNLLSQQTEIKLDSPYFDIRTSFFEDRDRYNRRHGFGYSKGGFGTNFQGFLDHVLATTPQSTSSYNEVRVPIVRAPDNLPKKVISSSSAMDNYCTKNKSASSENKELNNLKPCDQIRTPILSSSMSTSQLVNHSPFENDSSLDEMAQKLLSDFQFNSNLDEQSLMKRVHSFCSLIQQNESIVNDDDEKNGIDASHDDKGENGEKQQSISRRNSYNELLMNLPRIESVPQLFNIYEDCQIQDKFMI